jgi:hypothetical protein
MRVWLSGEYLPSIHETLGSTTTMKKKEKGKGEGKGRGKGSHIFRLYFFF